MEESSKTRCKSAILLNQGNRGRAILRNAAEKVIVLLPAIVFLVSGSIGFRGLVAMSSGNTALGQSEFIQMFVVALTIGAGVIVGNTLYRPRITL